MTGQQTESDPEKDSVPFSPPALVRSNSTGHVADEPTTTRKRKQHSLRLSVHSSTETNHRQPSTTGSTTTTAARPFVGAYAHIRRKLDDKYHVHYTKSRQWLHDSIVDDYLQSDDDTRWGSDQSVLPCEPMLLMTVGVQGAGKHHTIGRLIKSGRLPLLSSILVDTDEIRRLLPEYHSILEESPHTVDYLTQKESSYIAETLVLVALQAGRNVILDSSLQDVAWYQRYLVELRLSFPTIKIALIHVVADRKAILHRVQRKARETGKAISEEQIRERLEITTEAHVNAMEEHVDYFCRMENNSDAENPVLLHAPEGGWERFHSFFEQEGIMAPRLYRLKTDDMRKHAQKGRRNRRRFSAVLSSEENHKSDDPNAFYGPYSHIRKTIDYTYHSNYTFERQRFQDAIITEFLNAPVFKDKNGITCTTPTEPWIVFTAGAMGSGKSYTLRMITEMGLFPLLAFVRVDPDEIRRFFPEFKLYVEQSPELAGELTRKEAGFISEILTQAALQAGKNVLVDGSLRDANWYQQYFGGLRTDYSGLRIAIIHVSAPREAVFQRAAERALATGRIVPKDTLMRVLEQVPKSVKQLAPTVDYYVEISNGDHIELVNPPGETWESFNRHWLQTCAWVPSKERLSRAVSKSSLSTLSDIS